MKNKTKNKLTHLNDHLFAQLERLEDESEDERLEGDKLRDELQRAKSITSVATQIIATQRLALDAQKAIYDRLIKKPPEMLGIEGWDEEG